MYGVDINNSALQLAKTLLEDEKINNTKLMCCDIRKTGFREKYFDTVFALQIMEHIYESDLDSALCEISRILTNNGYFIFEVPHKDAPYYKDEIHVTYFTEEKITMLLCKHFKILNLVHETRNNPAMPGKHNDWRAICQKK